MPQKTQIRGITLVGTLVILIIVSIAMWATIGFLSQNPLNFKPGITITLTNSANSGGCCFLETISSTFQIKPNLTLRFLVL